MTDDAGEGPFGGFATAEEMVEEELVVVTSPDLAGLGGLGYVRSARQCNNSTAV